LGWLGKILPRRTRFVGIDLGTAEVKMAEIEVGNRDPEVIALRRLTSPPGVEGEMEEDQVVEILKQLSPGVKEVISCLPPDKVVTRILRLPPMSDKEREEAVRLELERVIPAPREEMIIRSLWLEEKPSSQEGRRCLALAAPVSLVYLYHSLFARAGLTLGVLDLPAFALYRLFAQQIQRENVALVDVGARVTQVVITRGPEIVFLRSFSVGGDLFTRLAAEYLGVGLEEAEKAKLEVAATSPEPEEIFRSAVLELGREVKRCLDFCENQEGVKVGRIILSGGGAKLRFLPAFLESMLGVKTSIETPLLHFSFPYDPSFAIALGLALREVVK